MTGTIFTTSHFNGIALTNAATENPATIASGVYVGNTAASPSYDGDAVYGKVGAAWTVVNDGTVVSGSGALSVGIDLESGGSVTNAGTIVGQSIGVVIGRARGTVANFATIAGSTDIGVLLYAGGSVTSHSGSSAGLISGASFGVGIEGATGTVANFATITGSIGVGVYLTAGGTVTNGQSGSSAGLISGGTAGVEINGAAGTVANFATIAGSAKYGVYLGAGGQVTNGHSGSSAGLISGNSEGVAIAGAAGTVANFGTIAGSTVFGVYLHAGGRVTNGQSGSSSGLISGVNEGVLSEGAATVVNFATIAGSAEFGVVLTDGGSVTNGQSSSSAALISGQLDGVVINSTPGTLANFGTITASGGDGVALFEGGRVTNGQSGSIDASISSGDTGVYMVGTAGTVADFGVISGTNFGVDLAAGGSVTVNRYALISGNLGISIAGAAGTVISGGVISGSGGTALQFGASDDTLILDPTAAFYGKVDGGGGGNTLELRSGATRGTLSGLGTDFVNFAHIIVDPGADWTVVTASPTAGEILAASGGSNRLVIETAGTIDLTGISGFPTIALADNGANSISLGNANFIDLTNNVIAVTGGDFGNTVDASALTGTNRVVLIGGKRADHFTGGAGDDIFEFSAANLSSSDRVKGGGGGNELLMTSAGTITASGVSRVETFKLATGGANHLTLTSANFAGVSGHLITVDDGKSGNTITASTLPSADAIIVHAGTGTDTLRGGAGNDVFIAGGKTKMTGGAGKNQFTFAHIGSNTITDFAASAGNEIAFSNFGFLLGLSGATSTPKALPGSLIGSLSSGAFSNTKQRFAYKQSTGQLFFDSGGSGGTAHLVATLTGYPTLSAGHLFFVS